MLLQGDLTQRGGSTVVEHFSDDDYMVQVSIDLNSGSTADVWVRRQDENNGYRVRVNSGGAKLTRVQNGVFTHLQAALLMRDSHLLRSRVP